jgi:hypothetical protein
VEAFRAAEAQGLGAVNVDGMMVDYAITSKATRAFRSGQPSPSRRCLRKKRTALARTLAAHMNDCPVEYFWTVGPQAPEILHLVMNAIQYVCGDNYQPEHRATLASSTASRRAAHERRPSPFQRLYGSAWPVRRRMLKR